MIKHTTNSMKNKAVMILLGLTVAVGLVFSQLAFAEEPEEPPLQVYSIAQLDNESEEIRLQQEAIETERAFFQEAKRKQIGHKQLERFYAVVAWNEAVEANRRAEIARQEAIKREAARKAELATKAATQKTVNPPVKSSTANAAPAPRSGRNWYLVADCESGQRDKSGRPIPGTANWSINTGNGYYGGLQFSAGTWAAAGGHKYAPNAHQATPSQQIAIADTLGTGHWPHCGRYA